MCGRVGACRWRTMKLTLAKLPWLEIALAVTSLALVLQLFPSIATCILNQIDVRNWSRTTWLVCNALFVAVLVSVRFVPNVLARIRDTQAKPKPKRRRSGCLGSLRPAALPPAVVDSH
jgi:TctA family transporter